jgi:hypothetical protein
MLALRVWADAVEKGLLRESPRNIDSRSKANKQY